MRLLRAISLVVACACVAGIIVATIAGLLALGYLLAGDGGAWAAAAGMALGSLTALAYGVVDE